MLDFTFWCWTSLFGVGLDLVFDCLPCLWPCLGLALGLGLVGHLELGPIKAKPWGGGGLDFVLTFDFFGAVSATVSVTMGILRHSSLTSTGSY